MIKIQNCVTKKDIQEIKVINAPPKLLKLILNAVMIAFKEEPSWETAWRELCNINFYAKFKLFEVDTITPGVVKRLRKYTSDVEFTPENVFKVNKYFKNLVSWVLHV